MCPDENTLTQFARGGAQELPALEAHLDGCEKCRRAVAAAASEQTLPGQQPSHELKPGLRVDRYEIEGELGRGGMGVVYQARDVTLDRRVALKLLHARRDEAAQARLLREAQVMAKLSHPNVVPVFELGEWRGDLYLVMELVTGVTLEAWLKRAKHRRRDILRHFLQAGRGLAAAHAAGVVHRDFKPANVLVGLDDRVRVTDFGLSRPGPSLELPATNSAVVTRDGAIVGTLAYMAPEQLDGKVADERSDQFSFCVALAEALAGQRPFKGETWSELALSLGEKPRFATGIPSRLRGVLRKGLEREPSHRYASMTALLNAIERAQRVGWGAVGLTGLTAVVIAGLISAHRMQPPPPAVTASDQNGAAALSEDLAPVVIAAVDMAEGTIVTIDMLMQRTMPSMFVTGSVIKPDSASYIIGQPINVPVKKGDTLSWSQFEQTPSKVKGVLTAKADLEAGTVLTADLLEALAVPEAVATGSVVKPAALYTVLGHKVGVSMQKGDLLLWTQVVPARDEGPGWLSQDDIMKVMAAHDQDLATCAQRAPHRSIDVVLRWKVKASGEPYEVAPTQKDLADEPTARCIVRAVSRWKFPKREGPTTDIELPIRIGMGP